MQTSPTGPYILLRVFSLVLRARDVLREDRPRESEMSSQRRAEGSDGLLLEKALPRRAEGRRDRREVHVVFLGIMLRSYQRGTEGQLPEDCFSLGLQLGRPIGLTHKRPLGLLHSKSFDIPIDSQRVFS